MSVSRMMAYPTRSSGVFSIDLEIDVELLIGDNPCWSLLQQCISPHTLARRHHD